MAFFSTPRQSLERFGKRGMQRPARAQQLGLIVERTDENKIEFADLGNMRGQIQGQRIGKDAGGFPIERNLRRYTRRLAFDGNKGKKIQGGTHRESTVKSRCQCNIGPAAPSPQHIPGTNPSTRLPMDTRQVIDLFRRNGADLIHLFLVPILIALLPWKIGFRLLKRMARRGYADGLGVERAWQAARPHLPQQDVDEWKSRFRLLQLVERVDTWLVLLRSARWWSGQIDQTGDWPEHDGPFVILTYHWGGGQWIWRQLHQAGIPAHFLARRAEVADLGAGRLATWFARVREFGIDRQGGCKVIFTGGSKARIREALQQHHSVVGMLDLPASATQAVLRRPLLDGEVAIPFGLLRVAAEANAEVIMFSCAFDLETGRRVLKILALPSAADVQAAASRYVEHLDHCLRCESAFWQVWGSAPLMFIASTADMAAD